MSQEPGSSLQHVAGHATVFELVLYISGWCMIVNISGQVVWTLQQCIRRLKKKKNVFNFQSRHHVVSSCDAMSTMILSSNPSSGCLKAAEEFHRRENPSWIFLDRMNANPGLINPG